MIDYTEGSNKQYHTQLEENGVGDYVILTGDPKRVKDIASYLDDAYFVADNREYVTYSGYINGVLCSVVVVLRAKCKNVANKMQKIGFKKRHFKRLLNAK